jgi:hypothetical protein
LEEEWPLPDCVTYLPTPPSKRLLRGYEHNKLVAFEFATLLQLPFEPMLEVVEKKGALQWSPAKDAFFPNKTLLLLGDKIPEDRLFPCGQALVETYAAALFCLCFAN